MVGAHEAYDLFFGGEPQRESHAWGTVSSYSNGRAEVALNPSTTTDCACLCEVAEGDRVLVLVFDKGAVVLGKAV